MKLPPTFFLMLRKPPIRCLRWSIDRSLHIPIVRRFAPTTAITAPPPLSAIIDFVMERMIHGNMRFGCLVDAIHMFLKLLSVIIPIKIVMRYKQISMNHLVLGTNSLHTSPYKQSVHRVRTLPQRKQGLGQAY